MKKVFCLLMAVLTLITFTTSAFAIPCDLHSCERPAPERHKKTIVVTRDYDRLVSAGATSKAWAKYALKLLKSTIKNNDVKWKIQKTKGHYPSNNGWVELYLKNTETDKELYAIMNVYTGGDGNTSDRSCVFTYEHLMNPSKRGELVAQKFIICRHEIKEKNIKTTGGLRLRDYPEEYLITELDLSVEEAIIEFVSWLDEFGEADEVGEAEVKN